MRQDPGLDSGLAGSACVHVIARGSEKKVNRQGQKQSGEEQGSRGTEATGWDLSVAAPFMKRWAALRRQLTFVLMILFRWKSTARARRADPSMGCRPATVMPGVGGRGPLCPCLLKCTAQAMQERLHPSISQGNASNPPAGEGTPLPCRTAQAHSPSSHGRCQCSQALPGSRDLLLLCQGRIFQKMSVGGQKSLQGGRQSEGQRAGARGRFAEQRSQRRQRTARAGCETAGDRDFPEEAEQSLLKHRQAPKFTGLSAARWEFCFQIIYFNICHPSGVNFLSLKSDFFGLREHFRHRKSL